MNTQEIIAAIAAELTRLNKMPVGIDTERCTVEESWSRTYVHSPEIVLAALSGVAAEVAAEKQITIFYYKIYGINGKADTAFDGWQINDWRIENYMVDDKIPTYHEALIAALKQVESEVKK